MIYFIMFAILLVIPFIDFLTADKRLKAKVFNFTLLAFLLFRALRWETGCDFPQFYQCFLEGQWNNIFSYRRYGVTSEQLMEPGFVFLNVLIRTILPHYTFYLFIIEGFVLFSFAYLIRKYIPKYQLVSLTVCLLYAEIFSVRQTIATAILCYSYVFIVKRQLRNYLLMIFLAYLFHKSSLIMLPLYWLCRLNFKAKRYIIIYLCLVALRIILAEYLQVLLNVAVLSKVTGGLTEYYNTSDGSFTEISFMTIVTSVTFLLLCRHALDKLKFNTEAHNIMNVFSTIYFSYIMMNVLASIPGLDIFYRLSNNLNISYAVIIPYVLLVLRNQISIRRIATLGILVFLCYRAYRLPCFDEEGPYYKEAYSPYFSIFERPNCEFIRQNPWPYHNK